jgi:hypothetical protein
MAKSDLLDASDEQLRAELARRAKIAKSYRPIPLAQPDFSKLIACTEARIREIAENEGEDTDTSHYIYEEAMKAIYGPEVFNWINANQ